MLKNKYKHNQLFTTIIIISLFALPCLSFSNEKKLERLAQSLKNNYQLELSNQHFTQKSKQDIEPLFGTWVLLY